MKYYIGTILEVNGELEYSTQYLFQTEGNPSEYADKIAANWRGESDYAVYSSTTAYWNDGTLISSDGFKEVPEADFDVLSKYLAVL